MCVCVCVCVCVRVCEPMCACADGEGVCIKLILVFNVDCTGLCMLICIIFLCVIY